MQTYKAPLKDIAFLLETFGYEKLTSYEGYEDYDQEALMDMIGIAGEFCTNELLPLNRTGDEEGVTYNPETHEVTTPKGFKEAYQKFVENSFLGITHPVEYGGGGAPHTLGIILSELATSTNKSFVMCPGLTGGLIEAVVAHGSDELKATYLPKLISGEWAGTMCLTEPQCGTDLGLIKSKATPDGDGYRITGTKIWITFGEHDMTENIIHLVLARLPDAPPGIKGISLFLVPKFNLDGERNGIFCGGLEHKMGIHASPTCVMNLEDAKGFLVGEPHKGMRAMFTMMNNARLGVGIEGIALSEISYQTALAFAKDRRQSRSLDASKQDQNAAADVILVHPDVRRQLLNVKSTTEAMRGLAYWIGMEIDRSHKDPSEEAREEAHDLVALLTPVIKSYCTEQGFFNTNDAMQLMGGAGYTTDWSVEQYMRDLRIALIYEGTNHIQALDLVGRKLPRQSGRLYMRFNQVLTAFIQEHKGNEQMAEFLQPLKDTSKKLMNMTMALSEKGLEDPEEAGAVASHYLNLFAYTALSYVWCRQVSAALGKEGQFYKTKLKTARFFFHNVLPEVDALVAKISAGKQYMMDFDADEF